ncbi:Uncharacterised protein [Vibrio cholerae]|nr:Uncharacterised protein [Vibrio cholerae]
MLKQANTTKHRAFLVGAKLSYVVEKLLLIHIH